MANILLTQQCVRACPYCFAKKQMDDKTHDDIMSWVDFMYVADFFALSGRQHLSLLGGEPTLHPDFVEFVMYLYERKFEQSIFTSGIMSDKLLEKAKKLTSIPKEKLFFVCNVNHPSITPKAEAQKQEKFLEIFGEYCLLSFNIYTTDFDMSFLVDYINKYNLRKTIRIGITHPILGENNKYIDADDLKLVGNNLLKHYELLAENGIKLSVDCGFPLCMFDDDGLGKMYKLSSGPLHFSCGAAIDIGTNLDVWPCFPLSGYEKRSLYDFSSAGELLDYYTDMMKKIRVDYKGIYKECDNCNHLKSGLCLGGCSSYILRRNEKGN